MILIAGAIGCSSPSRTPVDASENPALDASQTNGEFGDACSKHTDCQIGYCVEPIGDTGGVCSRECNDDCPTDWECRTVDLPQVDLQLCVPAAQQLCLACASDDECGGGACITLDGAGHCTTPCTDTCATGYTCAPDPTLEHAGTYCQPVSGSCSCSDAMAGAERSCSESATVGAAQRTCFGTQMCNPTTGWSACTASVPTAETCDGDDNDCNFVIDDGVGGGEACDVVVAGVGSCPGVRSCDGTSGDFTCIGKTPTAESCNFTDDDCDTNIDEGFPGLNNSCTAGIGACTRYGSQRCNSAGTGVVCSAVAAQAGTESCNLIDDDCDTKTDETFKIGAAALGSVCSSGLGACARYGTYVCKGDGTGTQCSATAGTNVSTETCNYADDNCDGTVDNGFRDPATGLYTTDTNCGTCGTDCTTIYNGPNAFGACQVAASAQCVMRCDNGSGNLNGSTVDGCEFTLDAAAIYVSTTDATAVDDATCGLGPTGTGTGNHPCKTITQGLTRSTATSRTKILVADGTYAEGVTLVNGKNLLGGYRADTWERHLETTATVISGFTTSGNHDRTIVASGITSATLVEGFVIRGSFNSKPSGNSYAIYIAGSTTALSIQNNQIFAGRGGAGSAGTPGTNGLPGVNGAGAASTSDTNYIARTFSTCTDNGTAVVLRQYTNGGALSCGGVSVNGGNGGGNWCPPSTGANYTPNQSASEKSGKDGFVGAGTAPGAGADAGDDSYVFNDGGTWYPPIAASFGLDGSAGGGGVSAGAVGGCSGSNGAVVSGNWTGGNGTAGGAGTNGSGGGGGGAGGGGYCYDCTNGATIGGAHRLGGHGGGGGAGGCGGAGGAGGGGGGGSFAIFITGSAGQTPTITANALTRGDGGQGGNGGIGGAGGLGGQGGNGGISELNGTDKAGRGGDGGSAGNGAGGGGGCGGSSFGVFTSGIGAPTYCTGNTVAGGSAGGGGAGGFSGGNSGGAGAAGVLQACTSL